MDRDQENGQTATPGNDDSDVSLKLEEFLPYRLSILSNTVSTAIAKLYASQFDLSIPEWRVLAVVGRFTGLSAREVAERTMMDKVAVSRAVKRLQDNGRLLRSIADSDRRRSVLSLSEDGQRVYRDIAPLAIDYEKRLLEDVPPAQRDLLNALLDTLLQRAQKM